MLIAAALIAACVCAGLSYLRVLSATNLLPLTLFGAALILILLHMISITDRRY